MAITLADAIALWQTGWTAGETKTQAVAFDSAFPCSTHALRYEFRGTLDRFTIEATDTGTGFRVVVPAATTLPLESGDYVYAAFATADSGGAVTCVDQGAVTIKPNPTRVSHAQRCLQAIRARIEGRATSDQLTMQMGDVTLAYMTPTQLAEWESIFSARVSAELATARAAVGATSRGRILTEFVR
jgi:hypothetical protein